MNPFLRSLRIHQWAKNLLVFAPSAAAHRLSQPGILLDGTLAFASFCLLASATYLVNDTADAEHDRRHPTKRTRPVASGELKPGTALTGAAVLAAASLGLAALLPRGFLAAWLLYLITTTAYSMGLKRLVVLDVVILSSLYAVRVAAGALAVQVPLSRWFLVFAVFVFLSLALLKRTVEAVGGSGEGPSSGAGADSPLQGRGWRTGDLPVLVALGTGSALAASLVYCLFITGEDVVRLYDRPDFLWVGLPVLLYWLTRAWLLAARGDVHDDPVVFAVRDPASWASIALIGLATWMAS